MTGISVVFAIGLAVGFAVGYAVRAAISFRHHRADQDAHQIDEHRFTKLIEAEALRRWPNMKPPAAFTRLFTESGEESAMLSKAWEITKGVPQTLEVTVVGGPDQVHSAVNNTTQSEAYKQLTRMAEKLRESHPELSPSQAFSRAFQDPKNVALATAAHNRPQPEGYLAWPKFATPPSQPKRV